jgi:hypothetical protein
VGRMPKHAPKSRWYERRLRCLGAKFRKPLEPIRDAEKRSSNKEECYQVSVSEYYSSSKGYSHTRTWWHLSWHTDMPWGEIDL